MNQAKYIGMDVHQATISVAVMDSAGKLILESVLETKAATILQFVAGLRGSLLVTSKKELPPPGCMTCSSLTSRMSWSAIPGKCSIKGWQQERSDRCSEAGRTLAWQPSLPDLHGENGVRTLKELARSYLTITKDLTRVMSRIKAVYRSWAIPCAGPAVYRPRHRAEWLAKIVEPGVRLRPSGSTSNWMRWSLCGREHAATCWRKAGNISAVKLLRQIPYLGPIRSALLVALLETPHRFRTKRQLWAYSGFGSRLATAANTAL